MKIILALVWGVTSAVAAPLFAACKNDVAATVTAERYQIMSATTVRDKVTNLEWQRCPVGASWDATSCAGETQNLNWGQALEYAAGAGSGWRLPNTKELESLVKRDCYAPALEVSAFSDLDVAHHWTSTAALGNGGAWAVNLRNGTLTVTDKTNLYLVRLVRDVQ